MTIASWSHSFPSRTGQWNDLAPMIVQITCVKVGHHQAFIPKTPLHSSGVFILADAYLTFLLIAGTAYAKGASDLNADGVLGKDEILQARQKQLNKKFANFDVCQSGWYHHSIWGALIFLKMSITTSRKNINNNGLIEPNQRTRKSKAQLKAASAQSGRNLSFKCKDSRILPWWLRTQSRP